MTTEKVVSGADAQETSINWARGDKTLILYTDDSTVITKLKKMGLKLPTPNYAGGITVEFPLNLLTFRTVKEKKLTKDGKVTNRGAHMKGRVLSDEQKAKMKAGREAKKNAKV